MSNNESALNMRGGETNLTAVNGRSRQSSTTTLVNSNTNVQIPKVSVVIPTLNEARNLPFVLPRIPKWVHEVILIDGHSTDDTVEVARRLWPGIRVVEELRRGKGAALRAGFALAAGDIIVTLDADGSADPAEMNAFIGGLLSGADFVKGSRFVQGGGTTDMELYRRAGNWILTAAVRIAFGGRYTDLCYGFNAFWSDVLPEITPDCDGFEIETQMNVRALRSRLSVVEIASFELPRVTGFSKLNTFRDGLRVLRTILHERLHRPNRRAMERPYPDSTDGSGPMVVST